MEILMPQVPAEVITIVRVSTLFWAFIVGAILIAGQWWQRAHDFRNKMLQQWKPSLVIALLYMLSAAIGGTGVFPFYSVAIFCQAMIGLALAYSIAGYEPLPVTQAMIRQERRTEHIGRVLAAATVVTVVALVANGLSGILVSLFGETMGNPQAVASFFPNKWQGFFLLLAGAGIAEETTYRLVCVSLIWRLTGRPWVAIITSAILFGAYHLSPLDAAYRTFWDHPISIFTASALMGIVMGYVYIKGGYETAVLGHTLGDWVPFLLSRAA
jgi:membrane protease YdiL (CAAX protease family)